MVVLEMGVPMRQRLAALVVVITFCSAPNWALAADMNGDWTGMVNLQRPGDTGLVQMDFSFRVDQGNLTVAASTDDGMYPSIPVARATVSGNALSFFMDVGGQEFSERGNYDASTDTIRVENYMFFPTPTVYTLTRVGNNTAAPVVSSVAPPSDAASDASASDAPDEAAPVTDEAASDDGTDNGG